LRPSLYSFPGCQQQGEWGVRASREQRTDATDAQDTAGLLTTKLMVPVPRWRPVARQRLFALLDDGTQGPMTLLAAPAGYGKTLLLTSWTTGRGSEGEGPPGPVAWVRVGPEDDHPRQFWAHVLAALHGAGVVRTDGLLAGLNPQLEIGDGFVRAFVGGLSELDGPVVLILDDLHEATGQAVTGQLRFLLRHAPPQLRLVVATRADPPLALHRLRVAGQLSEIREAELAFTLEETRQLLTDHGVVLSAGELETLRRRTEGWAAGLRLAALSLRAHPRPERFVADLAGDDRAIAGYLVEEVLAAQPPELRAFLLRTSVAERLCGDLADALTGGSDGARVLARLEREHVFTSATGPNRTWYRYHPLFAELLRAELRYEHAAELPDLHRRAATWHAGNGRPVPAVRHALAAGDVDQAAALLATSWAPMLVEGQAAVLRELVSRLPGDRVRATPELAVVAALSRLAMGELEEADAWLGLALAAEPRFARGARHPLTGAALHLARLYRARLVGDAADAGPAARVLLASAGEAALEGAAGDDDHRTLALALLGAAQLWSGQLEDAAANLELARADAGRRGREVVALAATAHLALLEAVRGRLGRAGELGRLATEQARRVDWSACSQLACADLALAVCAYHRDDLVTAVAALDRATAAAAGDRPVLLATAILAGWLAAGAGAAEAALARLDAAELATRGRPPRLLRAAARAARAKLLAATGDEAAASAALGPGDEPRPPVEAVVSARLQLGGGDPAAAARTLAPLLTGGPGPAAPELPLAIEAHLVDALAGQELADRAAAIRSLRSALDLAAPEGYRRVFVEGGMPVRLLLTDHLHRDSSHHQLVASLLERLRAVAGADRPAGRPEGPAPLVVPLSERERVVLRYLSSRLSAGEIADELYVSLNTVKTHIKSIYRKLDTNRRWDAVKRARQLQLL
jgi:LuxR family transcriptional regulator, maltose regulon positive regulatory protein